MPGHVDASNYLGIYLGDAAPLRVGLPQQKLRDHQEQYGENGKPSGDEDCVTGESARNGAQTLLGKRQGKAIECHNTAAEKTDKSTLPYQVDLKPPREPTPHRELAHRALSHAQTTTLHAIIPK